MNATVFDDQHGQARRSALARMQQGKRSRGLIRRAVLIVLLVFGFINVLAAANPWLHRNDRPAVVCARSMA